MNLIGVETERCDPYFFFAIGTVPIVPVKLLTACEGTPVDHVGAVHERVGLRVATLYLLEGGAPRHSHTPLRYARLQEASPDAQQPGWILGVLRKYM